MHWCMDETLALLAMIPLIGYFFRKVHVWWHEKILHTCHEKHCDETHAEHKYSPYGRHCGFQKVSEEDMEYLRGTPAPLKTTIDVDIWDDISQEDVEERFGADLVFFFFEELNEAGLGFVSKDMIYWYVNQHAELRVEVQNTVFIHDRECCEHGWRVENGSSGN